MYTGQTKRKRKKVTQAERNGCIHDYVYAMKDRLIDSKISMVSLIHCLFFFYF
jgi:hypothetical protein